MAGELHPQSQAEGGERLPPARDSAGAQSLYEKLCLPPLSSVKNDLCVATFGNISFSCPKQMVLLISEGLEGGFGELGREISGE